MPGLRGVEHARRGDAAPAGGGAGGRAAARRAGPAVKPRAAARTSQAPQLARLQTGIGELDRVLGGGLVPGSLVLIGGSPGIGKSTLTSMALGNLEGAGRRTLYVSGEESAAQIRLRAERLPGAALQVPGAGRDRPRHRAGDARGRAARGVRDRLGADAARGRPDAARRARSARCARSPTGSRGWPRRAASRCCSSGHVTKEGALAGPAGARAPRRLRAAVRGRARAHLPHAAGAQEPLRLDQRRRRLRDAHRAASSRSRTRPRASSGEATRAPGQRRPGGDGGLAAAAGRGAGARLAVGARPAAAGRATGSTATGSRSCSPCSAATPGIGAGAADVFVNVAGGVRVDEPGADLAVALAVASAVRGVTMGDDATSRWRASARSG